VESAPGESLLIRIVANLFIAVVVLIPVVMVGAGGWLLWQRQNGERVEAEVIGCEFDTGYKSSRQYCTARWSEDGVERTGPIHASGDQEVGKTVTATLRSGELYSRSLTLPLMLLGIGLPFCVFPYAMARKKLRDRRAPSA
jgi:hypothetical protein